MTEPPLLPASSHYLAGISDDALQNRLFKPFSQVDASITRSHGGSGRVLLIVRELAVMMDGDAWATSKVGEGLSMNCPFSSSLIRVDPLSVLVVVRSRFSFSVLVKEDASPIAADEASSFPEQKALILCDDLYSRQNLIVNLHYLNVRLVMTFNTLGKALSPEAKNSLTSTRYDILLLNPDFAPKDQVARMTAVQPKARIFYLVKAVDLGAKVSELSLPTSAFLPRPIQRSNLYRHRPSTSDEPVECEEESNRQDRLEPRHRLDARLDSTPSHPHRR
jgi:hypothetical protein